jgi:transcriptional regulator with XRE-family HTH domain
MAVRIPAMVNPRLLVWAREQIGFTLDSAAERAGFASQKLLAWESGDAQPTLRQAERLAKTYGCAFGLFSLPAPPQLPPLASECRRMPGVRPGAEMPELRLAVKQLVYRRRIALHLYAELGDEPPDFLLRASLREDTESAGKRLREALRVSPSEQLSWPNEFVAYRVWRAAVESLGVLVCQFPGKGLPDVRGTSILHFPLPLAGVSSKELPLSKPFTLLHEVVHLALAANNEEKPALEEKRDESRWLDVERFCEAVAGAALMPADSLLDDVDVAAQRKTKFWEVALIRRTARRYRVTPTAIATRLLRLNVMGPRAYADWKDAWETYCKSRPEKPSFGIATPSQKAVGRNGPLFTSLVLSALSNERITSSAASNFLDLGYAHVETLRRNWFESPAGFPTASGD